MSERLLTGSIEDAPKSIELVRDVGDKALALVNHRYGTGFPDYCAGELSLGNHNGRHALLVGDGSARINEALGFERFDIELGRTAGRSHDLIQGKGRGIDERESAEWAEAELRGQGLPPAKAKLARVGILATLPTFDDDGLSGQIVSTMEFDSLLEEQFAKGLASADLGVFFTPFGLLDAHMLYAEMQGVGATDAPDMDKFEEFARKQVVMAHRYKYPLPLAEKLFATHKPQVIRYAEHVYAQVLRGDIESWAPLIAQDTAFYRNPDMNLKKTSHLAELAHA